MGLYMLLFFEMKENQEENLEEFVAVNSNPSGYCSSSKKLKFSILLPIQAFKPSVLGPPSIVGTIVR